MERARDRRGGSICEVTNTEGRCWRCCSCNNIKASFELGDLYFSLYILASFPSYLYTLLLSLESIRNIPSPS